MQLSSPNTCFGPLRSLPFKYLFPGEEFNRTISTLFSGLFTCLRQSEIIGSFCVLSSTSASISPWMETARRGRTIWGGRPTWWRRWLRSCSAWSPSAVTSSGKSETFLRVPSGWWTVFKAASSWLMNCALLATRLRPQDTDQRARLWKHLQSLLETYGHLRENDQSFLVEVRRSAVSCTHTVFDAAFKTRRKKKRLLDTSAIPRNNKIQNLRQHVASHHSNKLITTCCPPAIW